MYTSFKLKQWTTCKTSDLQDHPWRPVFYGVHSSLGHLSIGLALAAVYLTQTLANPLDQVATVIILTVTYPLVVQNLLPLWGMYASYGLGIWIVANHLFQTFYQCNKAVSDFFSICFKTLHFFN